MIKKDGNIQSKSKKISQLLPERNVPDIAKCQQLCFATFGCSAFTYFGVAQTERRSCVLFKDCNGDRAECGDCLR